jgi:hypothetical protein
MALDRLFLGDTIAGVRSDWREALETIDLSDDAWQIVNADALPLLRESSWAELAFIVPPPSRLRLTKLLAELATPSAPAISVYACLAANSILLVSPFRVLEGGLALAGGSYSTVSLHLENGRPLVRKCLLPNGQEDLDRDGRQSQECAWMQQLPPAVQDLFVPVIGASEGLAGLEMVTEFIPGHSLAELVFQQQLDGTGLARSLERIYSEISRDVWTQPPIELGVPIDRGDYLERIQRRLGKIKSASASAGGPLHALLEAGHVVVNGCDCDGVDRLLERLASDPCWRPAVTPGAPRMCHGDLILDDIVSDPHAPAGFRLVDPNPSNQHPMYDVFKTMMSLWLKYEFFYFDRFAITHFSTGRHVEIEIRIDAPHAEAAYDQAAEQFVAFAGRELATHLGFPSSEVRPLLRMGAAINMLAIPVFHLLHHDREPRALAFAATALLHAELATLEAGYPRASIAREGSHLQPSTRSL